VYTPKATTVSPIRYLVNASTSAVSQGENGNNLNHSLVIDMSFSSTELENSWSYTSIPPTCLHHPTYLRRDA
jgi:hypothetical protein